MLEGYVKAVHFATCTLNEDFLKMLVQCALVCTCLAIGQ